MRDRYTITERIAAGGQAEVFRGVAESLQGFRKPVAIKRVLPDLGKNPRFVAMFMDEAKLSLFLQHANIVQVFDVSRAPDDAYFLVMEFVDGCDLKALVEWHARTGRAIPVPLAMHIMIECCKALDYAHHLEHPGTGEPLHIVHRDVSPANILLSKNGEVKLVDFGLAKATSQAESTDPGVVKGKLAYLSPEAASGLPVDHRTDLFAVGILLWEMLTGARLFLADTPYATVNLVREARVPSIRARNPHVTAELEQIVRTALERDPEHRYQTAAELGDALSMCLFSQGTKVTSSDLARMVREVQRDARQVKRADAIAEIDANIAEEVAALASVFDEDEPEPLFGGPPTPGPRGGKAPPANAKSPSLAEIVDVLGWGTPRDDD